MAEVLKSANVSETTVYQTVNAIEELVTEINLGLNRLDEELFKGVSILQGDCDSSPVPMPPREPSIAERLEEVKHALYDHLVLIRQINDKVRD